MRNDRAGEPVYNGLTTSETSGPATLPPAPAVIRVAIIEDQTELRQGLGILIDNTDSCQQTYTPAPPPPSDDGPNQTVETNQDKDAYQKGYEDGLSGAGFDPHLSWRNPPTASPIFRPGSQRQYALHVGGR